MFIESISSLIESISKIPFLNDLANIHNALAPWTGLVTGIVGGGISVLTVFRRIFKRREMSFREEISGLEKQNKAKSDRIRHLEEVILKKDEDLRIEKERSAGSALEYYHDKLKLRSDKCYEQAICILEEWLDRQRIYISDVCRILAEHYVSYPEPEILRDCISKAKSVATVAIALGDKSEAISLLMNDIVAVSANMHSVDFDSPFERALDVIDDFAPYVSDDDAVARVTAAVKAAKRARDDGLYWIALHIARRAVRLVDIFLPDTHDQSIDALDELAYVCFKTANYSDGEVAARRVTLAAERISKDSEKFAIGLNLLGLCLQRQGKTDEAQSALERALEIREHQTPLNQAALAVSYNNLGELRFLQGRLDEAKSLLSKALAIRERLPEQRAAYANTLNILGCLLEEMGNFDEAVKMYNTSLKIRQQIFPEDHPEIANSLHNVGSLLLVQGRAGTAIPILEKALSIRVAKLGPEHPSTKGTERLLSEARAKYC
jgi:tetratricopeptide (TPR) repeat protein